ncbi:putative quinol monooxygenase [Rhodococcus sp. 1168]|uniref:putative quinol monooxygenase n=1 Tax=Rhodococcus sp. 1168 TaxID=2018041 RepID=UPI000A09D88F|nr:putative quinol monooxygenase [Rhodococcus sp. 1168]ORI17276.1 hypothetical protein BJI47_13615 [Rhodococcus sp. 1168]
MSIHIIVDFVAAPGEKQTVVDAFTDLVLATRAEPGCLIFDLYTTAADDNGMILIEEWDDQNAIDHHMTLGHTVKFLQAVEDRFSTPAVARRLEPVPA